MVGGFFKKKEGEKAPFLPFGSVFGGVRYEEFWCNFGIVTNDNEKSGTILSVYSLSTLPSENSPKRLFVTFRRTTRSLGSQLAKSRGLKPFGSR